jgi:hypothetical protein
MLDKFVIVDNDNKLSLAQVVMVDHGLQTIEVRCYEPDLPASSHSTLYTRIRTKLMVEWYNVISCLADAPRHKNSAQLSMTVQQCKDIQSICE